MIIDGVDCCSKGHPWTDESTRWESSGANGRLRKRCRICRREKKESQTGAEKGTLNGLGAKNNPSRRQPGELTYAERMAIREFDEALGEINPPCTDKPDEWCDYEEDAIPSVKTAEELCADCPVRALCRDAAIARGEGWGVWGGKVFLYGRMYNGGTA